MQWPMHPAMATTASELPGFRVRSLGIAIGSAVRDPGFWDMWKSKRPEMLASFQQARFEALLALMHNAVQMGANSVIGVRFDETTMPGAGASFTGSPPTLVTAYGTAGWADPIM